MAEKHFNYLITKYNQEDFLLLQIFTEYALLILHIHC